MRLRDNTLLHTPVSGRTSPVNCREVSSKHTTGRSGWYACWYRSSTSSIRATNSPLTLGIHHSFFCHGLSSFFEHLAHRLQGDAIGKLQLHRLVGQQLECPVRVPFRRGAARNGDQVRFLLAVQLALLARPRSVIDGGLKSFLHVPLPRSGRPWPR